MLYHHLELSVWKALQSCQLNVKIDPISNHKNISYFIIWIDIPPYCLLHMSAIHWKGNCSTVSLKNIYDYKQVMIP